MDIREEHLKWAARAAMHRQRARGSEVSSFRDLENAKVCDERAAIYLKLAVGE